MTRFNDSLTNTLPFKFGQATCQALKKSSSMKNSFSICQMFWRIYLKVVKLYRLHGSRRLLPEHPVSLGLTQILLS